MGFDLQRPNGSFHLNSWAWGDALRLASENGWEPAGTQFNREFHEGFLEKEPPEKRSLVLDQWEAEWCAMNYVTNDHQIVSREDAAALGEALRHEIGFELFAEFCMRGEFDIG